MFHPYEQLAEDLLANIPSDNSDGSHDLSHLMRVWANVRTIQKEEGGDLEILAASCVLHDCVSVEKNSPDRSAASAMAAKMAKDALIAIHWSDDRVSRVEHAIAAHSYSANITPLTIEAKILQDADRLDAIGFVGIARCFYIAGRMNSGLYDPFDIEAADRQLDGRSYAIDHFQEKLLKLSVGFQTRTGQQMAQERHQTLITFLNGFVAEVRMVKQNEGKIN